MAGLPNSSKALQQWQHLFEEKGESRTEQARQHLQQMLRLGLPTRKHEDWKYTPLEGLTHSQFIQQCVTISAAQRDALALQIDAVRLVFVDGRFMPELSDSTQNSGFDVSVRDERQTLAAPVQPEVFLHLTESGAMCHVYTGTAKSASDRAATVNAYHAGRGWRRAEHRALSPPSGAGGRRGSDGY